MADIYDFVEFDIDVVVDVAVDYVVAAMGLLLLLL